MLQIEAAGDLKGAIIAKAAAAGNCSLCQRTMQIFTRAYGAEAGVAALKWLPYGGLYLTGGLTPKNIDYIRSPAFMEALLDKGRVSGMLNTIPVIAVLVENLGERGAQYFALKMAAALRGEAGVKSSGVASAASASSAKVLTVAAVALAAGAALGLFLSRQR